MNPDSLQRIHGIVPAMATPFTEHGDLDEARITELIDWYLSCGVHGISVAGSQGEFFALEEDEHIRLIEVAARAIDGRVPLLAGTGAATTRRAIRITQAAEKIGIDLAMVITPYFIQPNQAELSQHYLEVAASTSLPIVLYNNPPRTSVHVLPTTLAECMRRASNIVGIKDSSGDVTQAIEYKLLTDGKAMLFSGRDTIVLSLLMHGAEGSVSPAANVFPVEMVRLYEAFRRGDLAEARRLSDIFAPLRAAWAWGSFPVVIKEAMALVNRSAGPARHPIAPLPAEQRSRLRRVVEDIQAQT